MIYIVWILDDTMNPSLYFFHNKKAADEFLKNNPSHDDPDGCCLRSGLKTTTWIPTKKRFCERATLLLGD